MIDQLYFCVIYAIPNLAYHENVPGFGMGTPYCNQIMNMKLDMQKKVYNDK